MSYPLSRGSASSLLEVSSPSTVIRLCSEVSMAAGWPGWIDSLPRNVVSDGCASAAYSALPVSASIHRQNRIDFIVALLSFRSARKVPVTAHPVGQSSGLCGFRPLLPVRGLLSGHFAQHVLFGNAEHFAYGVIETLGLGITRNVWLRQHLHSDLSISLSTRRQILSTT